jgi:pyruvate kinase
MSAPRSHRRTKIVATLGPATDDPRVLGEILEAGADVVRVNFSHGEAADQARRVKLAREVAEKVGRYVGVLCDLAGPKIRIERFVAGKVLLNEGAAFTLDTALDANAGTANSVGVAYKELPHDVRAGDELLLADGLIVLSVRSVEGTRIVTQVVTGGELSNQKGLNRRGGGLSAGALTPRDRDDIRLAASLGVDYLAVSFPKDAEDMAEARSLLTAAGGHACLCAKIERTEAVRHLDSITEASDAVMVARGDLGVEMGYAELTGLQKRIIRMARQKYRVVITATQMMESMISSPVPTRAEVSDVANAVIDGSDAVMLSAESAVGRYPVRAVEAMDQVIEGAEKYQLEYSRSRQRVEGDFSRSDEAIAKAVMYTANHMDVKAIVALTESGSTTLWMSRIRSDIPIYAFTRHQATRQRVTLYRGVYPVAFDVTHCDEGALYPSIFQQLVDLNLCQPGDAIIVTQGEHTGVAGGTNSMKILTVRV